MTIVRRLGPDDASQYRNVMLTAYNDYPHAFTTSLSERRDLPLSFWEERLNTRPNPKEVVFGAWDGDALVGSAGLGVETREKLKHKATLFGMFVRESHRKLGIGGQLVNAVLNEAQCRHELRIVQLTVTHGNTAKSLYEKHGFVEYGFEPFAVAVEGAYIAKCHLWFLLDGDS